MSQKHPDFQPFNETLDSKQRFNELQLKGLFPRSSALSTPEYRAQVDELLSLSPEECLKMALHAEEMKRLVGPMDFTYMTFVQQQDLHEKLALYLERRATYVHLLQPKEFVAHDD